MIVSFLSKRPWHAATIQKTANAARCRTSASANERPDRTSGRRPSITSVRQSSTPQFSFETSPRCFTLQFFAMRTIS